MNNLNYLEQKNSGLNSSFYKVTLNKGKINIHLTRGRFDSHMTYALIGAFKEVVNRYPNRMPIIINFGIVEATDKLSYILVEAIIYYYKKNYSLNIKDVLLQVNFGIQSQGVSSSPLLLLSSKKKKEQFDIKFYSENYNNHYRVIVSKDASDKQINIAYTDICNFLKFKDVPTRYTEQIGEMVIELIENSVKHANTDCLIDIDVTSNHTKKNSPDIFYGINIVVLNFSDTLFHEKLQNRILNFIVTNNNSIPDRYKNLIDIYNYHKAKLINKEYSESDFWKIASFQHKISGRELSIDQMESGGRGLTKLIKSLQIKADSDSCYLLSGKDILYFDKDYLPKDDSEWIGFNDENNFKNVAPNLKLFSNSEPFYLPGSAFNLNIVVQKENSHETN